MIEIYNEQKTNNDIKCVQNTKLSKNTFSLGEGVTIITRAAQKRIWGMGEKP